jgi:MFS family permease
MSTQRALFWLVGAGAIVSLVTLGLRAGFGLFLEPMSATYGWGREVFALAIALQNLIWGLGQPFAGALADRFGAAKVLVAGGVMYAAGVAFMSFASSPLELHLTVGVMVGLGTAGASFTVVLAAVGRLLPAAQRGWAFGLVTAAGSLGQFLLAPLGQALIASYGWATALLWLTLAAAAVIPMALAFRADRPLAKAPGETLAGALAAAARSPDYWCLLSGFFVCGFHVALIQTHLPAALGDAGLTPAVSAWALGLIGLFNVAGAYAAGPLGERVRKKWLLSAIYASRAVVLTLFVLLPVTTPSALLFAAAMGFLWLSTVPPTSGLVAHLFGPRYLATLFGIVFMSHQVGAFLGAWLGGIAFDRYGTYDPVWGLAAGLGVFAALVNLPIREGAPRPAAQTA